EKQESQVSSKKTEISQSLISGGMFEGAEFGGDAFGKNKLTQHIVGEKKCLACQEVAGKKHSNNCQCKKENDFCGHCQTDQANEQCSCKKVKESEEISNIETKIIQALITGGEFKKAKFTGHAFAENDLS